jgi:SPP1 family predicted phage head-tail adaptor
MLKLNRRIVIRAWGATQNEIGGLVAEEIASWALWANVEDRQGSSLNNYQQEQWQYDFKVVVRHEVSRKIGSNYTVDYDGKRLKINSVSHQSEAFRMFDVLRCEAIDGLTGTTATGSSLPLPSIGVYTYTGTGGEYTFTALAGKTIFGVSKDGVIFDIISTSPVDVEKKQVRVQPGNIFTFLFPFAPGETANVQYFNL